ncbi:MAG: methionyl-tRNA formyltransferase [Mucinivorans sp.]
MNSHDLRIVFMGTPEFAAASLAKILECGYNVVGVVTVPDRQAGRGLQMQQSAVKKYALENGLHVLQPEKLKNEQWVEEFRALRADLAIVVAFRMLPEVIWSMPPLGTFNLHASLLPAYRGAAPINWAIINGDSKTGVTTFFLDHNIDSGEIIDSTEVEISETDNAGALHDRLMAVGAELVIKTIDKIVSGCVVLTPQTMMVSSPAPKIFKDDCRIFFDQPLTQVYNKIRGLAPYPAAWCELAGTTIKIFDCHPDNKNTPQTNSYGVFENIDNKQLRVSCADGWLYIDTLQLSGKRAMSAAEFLRGNGSKLGL